VNVTTSLGVGLIGQQGLGGVGAIGKTLVLGLELRKEHELAMKKHYLKARDRFADIVHSVLAEHLLSHFWRRLDNITTSQVIMIAVVVLNWTCLNLGTLAVRPCS
jgi:hypothetical protein